tara:strand:+ start:64 stop:876 length:813 start_codon:yes stop_codon:yes gene_type:complete
MIPHILTDNSLTVVIDGKAQTMQKSHPSWERAKLALQAEDFDLLEDLFDVAKAVPAYSDGLIEVVDGQVLYDGEEIHNHVVDRLLYFMRENLPYQPLVKFLGKLMDNPSARATNELYAFLEHKNMPLTPDGNFLAYKGVNHDFTDKYSGKFDNSVGQTLKMTRNTVCDDANIGCSAGFHAGSYEYAKGYASGGGHLMVVEIDPSDVVSVPHDCECQKLRTSKYKVVGVYETIDAPPLQSYDDDYVDWDEEVSDDWNDGYAAGYNAAQQDK